jgi:hypothetical protein
MTTHLHLVFSLRMRRVISPLPPYVCMAGCLFKHRDNFNFYSYLRSFLLVFLTLIFQIISFIAKLTVESFNRYRSNFRIVAKK